MVKLVNSVDTFTQLHEIFFNCNYNDDVIGRIDKYVMNYGSMKEVYDEILKNVIHYTISNTPSYYNASYPRCISTNIGPFGFSYMKDGLGIGINTRVNRKTGDVVFTITFYFNKDKNFLKHNDTFNYCLNEGFDLIEIENKKNKK